MAAVPPPERASGSQHHGKDVRKERSPGRAAGAGASAGHRRQSGTKGGDWTRNLTEEADFWEPRAAVRNLPAGKRQVLEKFFTPVRAAQQEDVKVREQHRDPPRRCQPRRCQAKDSLRLDVDGSHSDTFATHSSVSSTASSSWSSEASIDSETFFRDKRLAPQHSLSCTNIPSGQHGWDEEEDQRFKGRSQGGDSQHELYHNDHVPPKIYHMNQGQAYFPKLQRGQSKSEERLLRDNVSGEARTPRQGHSPLYKSASLGRSLAFSDSTEILLGSRSRKKSVSSVQLPSKGILKNKLSQGQESGGTGHFRKAKSMEVLSAHVEWTGPLPEAMKTKQEGMDLEKKKEAARNSLVQEKLQFSAFLNEITRQVISPSRLSSLGVTNPCEATHSSPTSSKPPKEVEKQQARRSEEASSQTHSRNQLDSPDSRASSVHSPPDHHPSCSKCHRQKLTQSETPRYQHHTLGSNTDASTSAESLPAKGEGQKHRERKRHQSRSDHLHTDGASSGSELSPYLRRQPPKQVHQCAPHSSPSDTSFQAHPASRKDSLIRESDTSWCRERGSSTSPSPSQSDRHKEVGHRGSSVQQKFAQDAVCDVDKVHFLQEQNEELHHSFLQTVVRMECMEAELQRAHEELDIVKKNFKRLQDSYSGTQETNHLLGQKLYSVVQTLEEEREHLITQISELSMQLATAQTTIFSLETINIPSLLRELLEKHFQSEEAVKEFLLRSTTEQSVAPAAADQSHAAEMEEHLGKAEVPQRSQAPESGAFQQRVTAFLPWKQQWDRGSKSETESGAEAGTRQQCQHLLHLPHLQFTVRPEALLNPAVDVGLSSVKKIASSLVGDTYRVSLSHRNPPIRILSTSPEQIHSPLMHLQSSQEQAKNRPISASTMGSGPMLSSQLHKGSTVEDLSDNIISSWRGLNNKATSGTRKHDMELSTGTVTYQQAQKMLDDFMYQLKHPAEEAGHGGHFRGWARCSTDEVLNGERTQL